MAVTTSRKPALSLAGLSNRRYQHVPVHAPYARSCTRFCTKQLWTLFHSRPCPKSHPSDIWYCSFLPYP